MATFWRVKQAINTINKSLCQLVLSAWREGHDKGARECGRRWAYFVFSFHGRPSDSFFLEESEGVSPGNILRKSIPDIGVG